LVAFPWVVTVEDMDMPQTHLDSTPLNPPPPKYYMPHHLKCGVKGAVTAQGDTRSSELVSTIGRRRNGRRRRRRTGWTVKETVGNERRRITYIHPT